jgi:hypothetical protein
MKGLRRGSRGMVVAGLALVALMGAAVAAHAGSKVVAPVRMGKTGTGGWAYGSLGSARNSANINDLIDCSVYAFPSGITYAGCRAVDAAGNFAYCYAGGASQVYAAISINSDSYIYFNYDSSGTCTYLSVTSGSQYEPKRP